MNTLPLNFEYDKITEIMDKFILGDEEGKPYDSIMLSGFVPKKKHFPRSASVVLEPIKFDFKTDYISLSEIKKVG